MRRKLSEILSTIDQFNGTGKYSDQYVDGDLIDIETDMAGAGDKATINNNQEETLEEMLKINNDVKTNNILPHKKVYVMKFEQFINENNYPSSSNVQSYFGHLDNPDDEEEE